MEFRFDLNAAPRDPFDQGEIEVRATIQKPDGKRLTRTAFFDGGQGWAVRIWPDQAGEWRLGDVRVNGKKAKPARVRGELQRVATPSALRFVRLDRRRKTRFVDDAGRGYWPIGHNLAWSGDTPRALNRQLREMGDNGLNWARIWMCHWDGKNLDWPAGPAGRLNIDAARRWDAIVAAAEAAEVRFQLVLQHHGPYSSRTDSNWGENPWNKRNGGFLDRPDDFFTHPEARRRTRLKLRYSIARWGYSPAILAWELFNEVEWVDAIVNNRAADVAAWHKEMADVLRDHDPERHLVTTSSRESIPGLYDAMDFRQPHAYPPDGVATVRALVPSGKPSFLGEIGPGSFDLGQDDGRFLRPTLWAGIATQESGAPQYWAWDTVQRRRLYPLLRAAARFAAEAGIADADALKPASIAVATAETGEAGAGPGGGWGTTKATRFPIAADGEIDGIGAMPAFLQGDAHREMFPFAELPVECARPTTLKVTVRQSAKAGATLVVKVDGAEAARREFAAADRDTNQNATVEASIPAGRHTVRLENAGADWLVLGWIALTPYGAALRALGRSGGGRAVVYLWKPGEGDSPVVGEVSVPGLAPGAYTAVWWDTRAGEPVLKADVRQSGRGPLRLTTPPVRRDIGLYIVPSV